MGLEARFQRRYAQVLGVEHFALHLRIQISLSHSLEVVVAFMRLHDFAEGEAMVYSTHLPIGRRLRVLNFHHRAAMQICTVQPLPRCLLFHDLQGFILI